MCLFLFQSASLNFIIYTSIFVNKTCSTFTLLAFTTLLFQTISIKSYCKKAWNIIRQAFLKSKKTMFENTLEELGLEYKVIKPHTPKQNGSVERSHRKDQISGWIYSSSWLYKNK